MIIIDEYTEKAITQRIELIQKEATPARCIHFCFSKTDIKSNATTPFIQHYVETNIETTDQTQLFVCEDADAYLVGNSIATKDIQLLIKHVGDSLSLDMAALSKVYELPAQAFPILTSVDEKIQSTDGAQKDAALVETEAKQQQKRSAILNVLNEEQAKINIPNTRKNRSRPQMMVIEDDAFTRTLVTNIMKKQYPIEGTGVPMDALQMYVRLAPDVLFLDINLPDITGHELLDRILEIDPDAYVVMLSGNADAKNITAAMSKGAKGFVGKPFTKEKLLQYIEKRLGV